MTDRNPVSEQERAELAVRQQQLVVQRSRQMVRRANDMLRQAVRAAEVAEADLDSATRRLERMPGLSVKQS